MEKLESILNRVVKEMKRQHDIKAAENKKKSRTQGIAVPTISATQK